MKAMGKGSIASVIKVLLDVSWYGSFVFLGLVTCLLVVSLFLKDLGPNVTLSLPVSFDVDSNAYRVTSESLGIENAQLRKFRAEVHLPVRKGGFFFGTLTGLMVSLAVGLWVLTQLRHIFRTLRDGRPFVAANAARIRWVGLAVIIGEIADAAIRFNWSYYFSSHFTAPGVRFVPRLDINGMAIVSGLILLVLAEVFREGTRLKEDQSLTI
ncbi:MAG TPA: DUF2975 domain-containing protein [Bryobacteraceae bacterium]|nr:DUF2975 domain-containing protein [Bryobacteraceae bacterium]